MIETRGKTDIASDQEDNVKLNKMKTYTEAKSKCSPRKVFVGK